MLRTHTCGESSEKLLNQDVTLCGWVARVRDHGGVNFVDLRDRWGVTQVVFRPELDAKLHESSKELHNEFCITVTGTVQKRPAGTENTKLPTGAVEVLAKSIKIFSRSTPPPFEITDESPVGEEVRLKYRFLDLRRPLMQDALIFRSRLIQEMRNYLHGLQFVEVETPVLTKSTPEGARDYLVPSRVNPGQFFALPQSPQLFKQLLMVSGYDRYFQVAKCFRDEDLRADRQPEFTQLDVELSFITKEDVFRTIEGLFDHLFKTAAKKPLKIPFKRLNYADAMKLYGTDKPDLRFDLPLTDLTAVFKSTGFKIFKQAVDSGGAVIGLRVPGTAEKFSRKDFDDLIEFAKTQGAGGLAYLKVTAAGVDSPIAKFLTEPEIAALKAATGAAAGDVVFFGADAVKKTQMFMGAVRLQLGRKLQLAPKDAFSFLWVDEFPLFAWNEEDKRWDSEHHPFTSPHADDIAKVGVDNGNIRSQSYDLVLNGNEIASGSIRIHDEALQKKIFETIGIDAQHAEERFGFLLSAFRFGPPPHGGIAIGCDRLATILLGRDSIREVVAFPKTQKAVCPLTDAPSPADPKQLRELGIKVL